MAPRKALETIGETLNLQYKRWQPRARYKISLDPTVDEVKKAGSRLFGFIGAGATLGQLFGSLFATVMAWLGPYLLVFAALLMEFAAQSSVSRARLPSQAKRALQQSPKLVKKANSAFMREAVVNSDQELIQTNGFDGASTNEAEIGGVLIMQRCYRGYRVRCYVNELKRSVIILQSLIRAKMSRKAYQHLAERLSPNHEMLRPNVQDVQSHLLPAQNGAIILLQSALKTHHLHNLLEYHYLQAEPPPGCNLRSQSLQQREG